MGTRWGLLRNLRMCLGGKSVIFPDPKRSNLLLKIALYGDESYEGELVQLLKNYPWPVGVFFDVGANVGLYSTIAELTLGESVTVNAVEPFPANVAYLERLKDKNNLSFNVIKKALSETSEDRQTLYFPTAKSSSYYSSSASLRNSFLGTGETFDNLPYETVAIETTTLSSIVEIDDAKLLIKLDCEGSELDILKSSSEILQREDVDWIVELLVGDNFKNELFSYLTGYGYLAYLITNGGLVPEERPLTLPSPEYKNRTLWKNHFFSKRPEAEVLSASTRIYGQ